MGPKVIKNFFFLYKIFLETNKKNIQMFILESLIYNIKLYLRNLDCSKGDENETYTLTLKYDSYVNE